MINDHTGWLRKLVIHNKRLYSCSYDTTVRVWNLTSLSCEQTLQSPQRVESCCVWQDFVFVGSDDARMRVYVDGEADNAVILKEHTLAVLAMIANDDIVVSGSYDGTLKVWGVLDVDVAAPEAEEPTD